MAALLGLPEGGNSISRVSRGESEVAWLAMAIRTADSQDEPELLDRLTRLAGEVEGQYAATHSRFSASNAYFDLVRRRIENRSLPKCREFWSFRPMMLSPRFCLVDMDAD